jgi:hypothetical protein
MVLGHDAERYEEKTDDDDRRSTWKGIRVKMQDVKMWSFLRNDRIADISPFKYSHVFDKTKLGREDETTGTEMGIRRTGGKK